MKATLVAMSDRGSWPERHWFGTLLIHAVLLQAATFVLRPMTSYRAIELGAPVFWLGALSACFALVPLLIALPIGRATDLVGEGPILRVGAALMLLSAIAYFVFRDSILGLAVGSVILGTGQLLSVVGEQAMLANKAPRGQYDSTFGHYTFAAALGQTLGPALIVLVGGSGAYPDATTVLFAAIVLTLLLGVSTVWIRADSPTLLRRPAMTAASIGDVLRLPGLARALIASSIVLSAVDILVVYLPAVGLERALPAAVIGTLLAIRSGASMVSRFFLGDLARRLGRRRLLVSSIVTSATAMALLAAPMPVVGLAILVAIGGFALGIGQPLTMSWLAEASPSGLRGTAMSLRLAGNRLGQTIVPASIGLVATTVGVAGVMGVTSLALLAAALSVSGVAVDPPADG